MNSKAYFGEEKSLSSLDNYIQKALEDGNIPGIAGAIVKDDKIVYLKGFGYADKETQTPVNETTLFPIGSTTKAFTGTALGILVAENKLTWDTPVREVLPEFQLFDSYATSKATVRDLLSHRLGLGDFNGDVAWYFGEITSRNELMKRLQYLEPSLSFRENYSYSNLGYFLAGQIIPALTKKSWDDFVQEHLLTPLAMNNSVSSGQKLPHNANVATAYGDFCGILKPINLHDTDVVAPSGNIYSNAQDMGQWLRFNLAQGKLGNIQILNPEILGEIHNPQVLNYCPYVTNNNSKVIDFLTHSLGWLVCNYRTKKVLFYVGQVDGMSSVIGMLPH